MVSADGLAAIESVLAALSSCSIRRVLGCDLQGKLMDLTWHLMLNFEEMAIFLRRQTQVFEMMDFLTIYRDD